METAVKVSEQLVDDSVSVKTLYETIFRNALTKESIPAFYEAMTFPASPISNPEKFYIPDFITAIVIKGKYVVIEPHTADFITLDYLEKIKYFKDYFHFYMVLASDKLIEKIRFDVLNYVDEYWFVADSGWIFFELEEKRAIRYLQELKSKGEVRSIEELSSYLHKVAKEIERINTLKALGRQKGHS
ncbi:MAG: hypothetical protein ACP5RK_02595 [Candidatus Micrarchaeia archaeon]